MPDNLHGELRMSAEGIGKLFRFNLILLGLIGTILSFSPKILGIGFVKTYISADIFLMGIGCFFASLVLSSLGILIRFANYIPEFDLMPQTLNSVNKSHRKLENSVRRITYLAGASQIFTVMGFLFLGYQIVITLPKKSAATFVIPLSGAISVFVLSYYFDLEEMFGE
jgi:hypothetical protein